MLKKNILTLLMFVALTLIFVATFAYTYQIPDYNSIYKEMYEKFLLKWQSDLDEYKSIYWVQIVMVISIGVSGGIIAAIYSFRPTKLRIVVMFFLSAIGVTSLQVIVNTVFDKDHRVLEKTIMGYEHEIDNFRAAW